MRFTSSVSKILRKEIESGNGSGTHVYFFPWLNAKPLHIQKYIDALYGIL